MELNQVLQGVEFFQGLTGDEIEQLAAICTEKHFNKNDIITRQGEPGNEMYIITSGFADVVLGDRRTSSARVVVSLGSGQIIGEMAILDQGPRSATVIATGEPTILQVIQRDAFEKLCQENSNIGYIVMRNLAVDLSFKLRHHNLSER